MLKGGIIMDVVNAEQARIAEEAGACAVMALERVPADIRRDGGVARMTDPRVHCTCTVYRCIRGICVGKRHPLVRLAKGTCLSIVQPTCLKRDFCSLYNIITYTT